MMELVYLCLQSAVAIKISRKTPMNAESPKMKIWNW